MTDREVVSRRTLTSAQARAVRRMLKRAGAAVGATGADIPLPRESAAALVALAEASDRVRQALIACVGSPTSRDQAVDLIAVLEQLQQAAQELREAQWHAREAAHTRVREVLAHLDGARSSRELVDQAVVAVCQLDFERAIISRIEKGLWLPTAVHVGRDAAWAEAILRAGSEHPQRVADNPIEAEILRTGDALVVPDVDAVEATHRPIAETSRSRSYVAAPIVAHDQVVGFVHGDCYYSGRVPDELDRHTLGLFGHGLGLALTRTAILGRLESLRLDLTQVQHGLTADAEQLWAAPDRLLPPAPSAQAASTRLPPGAEALTRRERDVLRWLAHGETNARIGRRLSITEGTVKTHVQSLLRKLGAANRAEAASLWSRIDGGPGPG